MRSSQTTGTLIVALNFALVTAAMVAAGPPGVAPGMTLLTLRF